MSTNSLNWLPLGNNEEIVRGTGVVNLYGAISEIREVFFAPIILIYVAWLKHFRQAFFVGRPATITSWVI